jgi:hypothetical protein
LKEITGSGKNVIDGNLRKAKTQAKNIILDVTNSNLDEVEILRQIESIFRSGRRGVETIIIKRGNEALDIVEKES